MTRLSALRRMRGVPIAVGTALAISVVAPVAFAVGDRSAPDVSPPPAVPARASQIQNIDQVKTAIKGYYGDTVSSQVDPVPNNIDGGDSALHFASATGSYHNEMRKLVQPGEGVPGQHRSEQELHRHAGHRLGRRRHHA